MSRSKNFSIEEDNYIRENYRDLFDDELAEVLGRPEGSVKRRRQRLGCWYVQQELSGSLPGEVWKSLGIDGDHYQISNKGRIKTGRKLASLFINKQGYAQWRVTNPTKGIAVSLKVHRAVAEAFCVKPEGWAPDWHVHHKDRNPLNNASDNLEWISEEDHRSLHKQ